MVDLGNHLYGVDLDPQAAEIATVNLMMRAMADQPQSERRLPLILNQNVEGGQFADRRWPPRCPLCRLCRGTGSTAPFARATGSAPGYDTHHAELLRQLGELTEQLKAMLDVSWAQHFSDVTAQHLFHWAVEFPEVFVAENGNPYPPTPFPQAEQGAQSSGFQVIVGNPPWEILKPDVREYYAQFDARIESKLTRPQVEARILELNAEDPTIESNFQAQTKRIEESAAYYRKATDYTRQGKGDRATHKLFVERGYDLLANEGRLGILIPSGIYTDLGTKPLREMLLNEVRFNTYSQLQ